MKDKHIINLIEETPVASLSEDQLTTIRAHVDECVDCSQAFAAAEVSALLLRERAAEATTVEPPAFFHTRVLATLRERQRASDSWAQDFWGLSKMWRAAGALASSMVATVAALAVLTFMVPATQSTSGVTDTATARNGYSAEEVIFNQGELADDQASDGQVLTTLYGADDEAVR